ncbi:hypothetical protein, partial [Phytohabitans kaempferiae]
STLAEKVHDNRFLRLLCHMLQAGYLEDWVYHATLSGAPQGGGATRKVHVVSGSRRLEVRLMPGT